MLSRKLTFLYVFGPILCFIIIHMTLKFFFTHAIHDKHTVKKHPIAITQRMNE
ncbi:hypothetical protein BC781_106123 [Sediminitomix flava]|uniref:Uncharacterized protein n=1 Tax=Sediminitomix flava TaxID=379075 RepID=A0A315Z677_SEDFL|nr:hypothetical protein BC781_106123 [Sediminitomix flava]